VPVGYVVNYVPKNVSLSNDIVSLTIEYKQLPGKIIATQNYVMKELYIMPKDLPIGMTY